MTKKKENPMTELKIGTTTKENLGRRDAFHVPCVLVQSTHRVMPGDNVKFIDDDFNTVVRCAEKDRHGIVDPFLTIEQLMDSEYFFILLNPNSVTKLIHHYELAIDVPKSKAKISKEKDIMGDIEKENARIEELARERAEEIIEHMRTKFELEKEDYEDRGECRGCY